jgi:50S ribosomal subunit-associated GTPase HflX
MDIDESQIDEQIEISALTTDNLDKLQNIMHKVLIKQPDSNEFNIDADNRYADFAECISKMQSKENSLIGSI